MEQPNDCPLGQEQGEGPADHPPSKRPRTTLACQRCKLRKQKCDGAQPECSSCIKTASECRYVLSVVSTAAERRSYTKALEERVAVLEKHLSNGWRTGIADNHQEDSQQPGDNSVESLSTVVRDLTLNASGHYYIGGTSNVTIGRLLGTVLHHSHRSVSDEDLAVGRDPFDNISAQINMKTLSGAWLLVEPVVDTLFQAYLQHVFYRYPIMYSKALRDIHSRRERIDDIFEYSILHLVYAIGGRALELAGNCGSYNSEEHYEAALALRERVMHRIDRKSIRFLALASLYCLRAPKLPGPWTMTGLAIKFCISLGLHRKSTPPQFGLGSELDKRLFWTCYTLDREVTLTMGRPPSICDHDIDVPLPLDIDEETLMLEKFQAAVRQDLQCPANPPTNLTDFIHTVRMKRIVSEIQHSIYRVDKGVNASYHIINHFLDLLRSWKRMTPSEVPLSMRRTLMSSDDADIYSRLHLRDSYMIEYFTSIRFLLFPQLSESAVNPDYLRVCAVACAGICKSYKRLHQQSIAISYTPISTMTLFLAGLTLIYCMWRSPEVISNHSGISALTDCTVMLYVLTERWPTAQKYRNTFERVKQAALELVANSRVHRTSSNRMGIGIFDSETRSALDSLESYFGGGVIGITGLNQMISDITEETTENPPMPTGDELEAEGYNQAQKQWDHAGEDAGDGESLRSEDLHIEIQPGVVQGFDSWISDVYISLNPSTYSEMDGTGDTSENWGSAIP